MSKAECSDADLRLVKRARHNDTICHARRPKSLLDLPVELLSRILDEIYQAWPFYRRLWACQALSTCKAIHHWLLPTVRDPVLMLVDWELHPPPFSTTRFESCTFQRKNVWEYVATQLCPTSGPYLRVLTVDDQDSFRRRDYEHFYQTLQCSPNLAALALRDYSGICELNRSLIPFRSESRCRRQQEERRRNFSRPTFGLQQPYSVEFSHFPILRRVRRVVILMTGSHLVHFDFGTLFLDESTCSSVFPSLTSVCLLVDDDAPELDSFRLTDRLQRFCHHHNDLIHLELFFCHDHERWENIVYETEEETIPCGHRVKAHIVALRELVTRARVSVTLHHQSYCTEVDYECAPFYHSETIEANTLRVLDADVIYADQLWYVKIRQLNDYYRTEPEGDRTTFDEFKGAEVFDNYSVKPSSRRQPIVSHWPYSVP